MQKDQIYKEYWLVNLNRKKVKRFQENKHNKDSFFEYIFINSGKISVLFGQQSPIMTKRKELKINKAREEWEKLLAQRWRQKKQFVNFKSY